MVLNQKAEQAMQKQILNVAILTPYLTQDFTKDKLCAECDNNQKCAKKQEMFGYDPKNIITSTCLENPKTTVYLRNVDSAGAGHTRDEYILRAVFLNYPELNNAADLVIAGSTENIENFVMSELTGKGLIIARYSIFYGSPSKYSGRLPEQSGYSLDIPKSVAAAKALLTNDAVLDAILARDEQMIISALDNLNRTLEQPILVTPYLKKALSYRVQQDNK